MSFDLYAFPAPGPRTVSDVHELLEAETENMRFDRAASRWFPSPGPEMMAFMDELERRWPSLDSDPDGSPWSTWPLWQPTAGGGTALNISWPAVGSVLPVILEIAARFNVIIYDPQTGELTTAKPAGER